MDYVHFVEQEATGGAENFINGYIYPKHPPNQVYLDSIFKDILQPVNSWLKNWENNLSEDIFIIFNKLLQYSSEPKGKNKDTLDDLFRIEKGDSDPKS